MSYDTDRTYAYIFSGKKIRIYKIVRSAGRIIDNQGRVSGGKEDDITYPDENISDGLRVEYTRVSEPFVAESLETTTIVASGITIAFRDNGGSSDTITDTASGFNFADGDKIRVQGSTSNDGDYTLSGTANTGTLTVATGTFTAETAGERITITQIPKEVTSPDTTSSINLNKMLCLAVVDYCKAMISERDGEIDKKEYYIKEFYSKLADNESNKRVISVAFPISPFAVR